MDDAWCRYGVRQLQWLCSSDGFLLRVGWSFRPCAYAITERQLDAQRGAFSDAVGASYRGAVPGTLVTAVADAVNRAIRIAIRCTVYCAVRSSEFGAH